MMEKNGGIPNDNQAVIQMLAQEIGKSNRGRNRILAGAVCACIVTLTMVFGISLGKMRAEYMQAVRAAGTKASACIERADRKQYEKVCTLGYVKQAGRSVLIGEGIAADGAARTEQENRAGVAARTEQEDGASGTDSERRVCQIQWLDEQAWEEIVKPAYTDIFGHYPTKGQELMLPVKALETLGISEPEIGMKISLKVNVGLFRTAKEEFSLCGWYTDYRENRPGLAFGYVSEEKLKSWGYDMEESDVLICQSDGMDWREVQKRLYADVPGEIRLSVQNTAAYDAIRLTTGGYDTAALGAVVVLGGMFFLVYNVMGISLVGDVRQMGLLNTIGATGKQLGKVYMRQILSAAGVGAAAGTAVSSVVLGLAIPKILGKQYADCFKGAGEFRFFYGEILAAAAASAVLLTAAVSARVIFRVVNMSCVESIGYTGLKPGKKRKGEDALGRTREERRQMEHRKRSAKEELLYLVRHRKRGAKGEILYLARQNVLRYKGRFVLTVLSLFLGIAAFFGAVIIAEKTDYAHVIERHPDFLIAGEMSRFGKEEGYWKEYTFRDAKEDPLKTEASDIAMLDDNYYDEFSPISPEVKERILGLDGVWRETSRIAEGAYMVHTIAGQAAWPFEEAAEWIGVIDEVDGFPMIEGGDVDVIQILTDAEMDVLRQYVKERRLAVDTDSLADGTGVAILHDLGMSPKEKERAAKAVGKPVYFTTIMTREKSLANSRLEWWEGVDEELYPKERQSEVFSLSGYFDSQEEDFPDIRRTWHGAEGMTYFLISEKGFEKLPTKKKTFCMELDAKEGREPEVKQEIMNICLEENRRREETPGTGGKGEGEAGIFAICKSELLTQAGGYIRGNRMLFGSISAVLLLAGAANFLNVMVTGILSRENEFQIMECVGMTKRQKRSLLVMEGLYYFIAVAVLAAVVVIGFKIVNFI